MLDPETAAIEMDEFCEAIDAELQMSQAPTETKNLVEQVVHRIHEVYGSLIMRIIEGK